MIRPVLFVFICFYILKMNASSILDDAVAEYSRCSFPCAREGHVFEKFDGSRSTNFSTGDLRFAVVTLNTSMYRVYCIERAGPFYLLGRTINEVNEYACVKDTRYDSEDIVRVQYRTSYKPVSGRPDICELCDGQEMKGSGFKDAEEEECQIVIPEALGCNIPWNCPVVDSNTQVQCSRCEPYEDDDGLCCDSKK